MAEKTIPTKLTDRFECAYPLDPLATISCGKTKITKKVNELTDADIEALIAAGRGSFRSIPVPKQTTPPPAAK